jgi:hypothetical protein
MQCRPAPKRRQRRISGLATPDIRPGHKAARIVAEVDTRHIKDLAYHLAARGALPGAFQLHRSWRVSLMKLRAAVHGTEDSTSQERS